MTMAAHDADPEGLPLVLMTPIEAMRVAAGRPMTCNDADGSAVRVRLFTADELLAENRRARAALIAGGTLPADLPMPMTEVQARMILAVGPVREVDSRSRVRYDLTDAGRTVLGRDPSTDTRVPSRPDAWQRSVNRGGVCSDPLCTCRPGGES